MSKTTEYIQERLKDESIPEAQRHLFEEILSKDEYHGFCPGQRVTYGSDEEVLTVITWDEWLKHWPEYQSDGMTTYAKEQYVPCKGSACNPRRGYTNGMPKRQVKPADA